MSNIIKKATTIAKAFTEPLPVDEQWFKDRVEICEGCEFNTKNMVKEDLSPLDKVKMTVGLCTGGDHCTACGCCIMEKSSQKVEQCGAVEKGLPPKWVALELPSKISKGVSAENLTPEAGELKSTVKGLEYDLGETAKERIDFSFITKRKGGLDIKSATAGCKCTVGDVVKLDEDSSKFDLSLTTVDFSPGDVKTRTFTIEHYATNSKIEKIIVTIKVKVK